MRITAVHTRRATFRPRTLVIAAEASGSRMHAKGIDCHSSMAYSPSFRTITEISSMSRV